MIVSVESNFVLELTYRQEEAGDCARILDLAEQKMIRLAIPACALFEPHETLVRRSKQRKAVAGALKDELKQLVRTDTYAGLGKASETLVHALRESVEEQAESLARTIDKVAGIATVIPLDTTIIQHARAVQLAYGLPAQDSVIFASLDKFLQTEEEEPKLFANKNRRDFRNNQVEERLAKYNCKLILLFSDARAYIEKSLEKSVQNSGA
jgi:predicted nucleic acid-binding protein